MYPFFENANDLHRLYQRIGVAAGVLSEDSIERWVEHPELRLGGSIDGEWIDGEHLVDFKTVNQNKFDYLRRSREVRDWFHHAQGHSYMKCTGKSEVLLVYINRNTPKELYELWLPWKDETWAKVEGWIKKVLDAHEERRNFPEEFNWDHCQGCGFYSYNRKMFSQGVIA